MPGTATPLSPASDIAFTPMVKSVQTRKGSRPAYERMEARGSWKTVISPDLAGFIAAVGGERPVVLGHSMGARIAVAMGALHPGVAGSFILADPPLTGPGRADYPTPLEAFRTQLHQAYAGTTAQEVLASYPRWPEREAQIRAEWLATCDENAIVETWNHFHDEDFFELWRAVASPILFIYGQESPVITPEGLAEVVADNPEVQVVGIPGAGHMIPWENLPDFLAAVRSFVGVAKRP